MPKPAQIDGHAGMIVAGGGHMLICCSTFFFCRVNLKLNYIEQELSTHMCTHHHHQHLQGHTEVFLMLFYSWGFPAQISQNLPSKSGSLCMLNVASLRQHRKKSSTQRTGLDAVHFILEPRLPWMQVSQRQGLLPLLCI